MIFQQRRWLICLAFAVCATSLSSSPVCAQNESSRNDDQPRAEPDHRVVLRLSASVLNGLLNKEIDHRIAVQDVVLGTRVTGWARIIGHPRVELEPSPQEARFRMVVTGTVYSQTVGRNGPAIIRGHSITRFSATKEVVFEPGKGFHSLPPQVTARSQCFTDDIQTTRGGLVGKIVERKASRELAEHHSECCAIAQDRARRRIAAAFQRHVGEQIARLNQAVELRTELASFGEPDTRPRVACRTTASYVEIASGLIDATVESELPPLPPTHQVGAPIEIWVHRSLLPANLGEAATTLFNRPEESGILGALNLLPGTFGNQAAAAITALVNDGKVAVLNVDDWLVVELNLQPIGRELAVRTLRR